ncbi:MAG: HAD family phosphatase [bacterium]|nr:HAD family phosphatase [bacterium]
MRLQKAIFDMDGLIFDSERLFMEYLGKAMAEKGYKLTREIYVNSLGLDKNAVASYMKSVYGGEYPFAEMSGKAREGMKAAAFKGLPVKKGIRRLLDYLKDNGIECVVASSSETCFVRMYLEYAGLLEYFTELTGGETVKKSKPEPEIFLKSLGGTEKSRAVILEDSENGVKAAVNAGIAVICIPDMKRPSEDVLKYALACVDDAEEAIEIIKAMEE